MTRDVTQGKFEPMTIDTARGWSWRPAALLAAVVFAGPALTGCTSGRNVGTASSYLIVSNLKGASGAKPTELANSLASDVLTKGGVLQDEGIVDFTLAMQDPGTTTTPSVPSPNNYITVSRYHVQYVRADGRNTPGVDVPYAFDGAIGLTVGTAGASGSVTLVRVQAKLEAPLAALANHGGAIVISTIAQITFYGKDQTGRDVSVTGQISVNFADWADPAGS
jgi:hypothetical protein